jgi:hypothetical protein
MGPPTVNIDMVSFSVCSDIVPVMIPIVDLTAFVLYWNTSATKPQESLAEEGMDKLGKIKITSIWENKTY